jgi:hypothetical protein
VYLRDVFNRRNCKLNINDLAQLFSMESSFVLNIYSYELEKVFIPLHKIEVEGSIV